MEAMETGVSEKEVFEKEVSEKEASQKTASERKTTETEGTEMVQARELRLGQWPVEGWAQNEGSSLPV